VVKAYSPDSRPPGAVGRFPPDAKVAELIHQAAGMHGVDPLLVDSVIRVESNYDPHAVSRKGAEGLMQLVPATQRRFGVANPFHAGQNIDGGVRYLKYLIDLYPKDFRLALAAYNAGEAAVTRYGGIPPYPETHNYVHQVGKRWVESKSKVARPGQSTQAGESRAPAYSQIVKYTDSQGKVYYFTR
jgi:soluble lytic murein transglycosylase-like protein